MAIAAKGIKQSNLHQVTAERTTKKHSNMSYHQGVGFFRREMWLAGTSIGWRISGGKRSKWPGAIVSSLTGVGWGDTGPESTGVDVDIERVSRGRHGPRSHGMLMMK